MRKSALRICALALLAFLATDGQALTLNTYEYSGKVTGYRVNGAGDVSQIALDTNNDGDPDVTIDVACQPNDLLASVAEWKNSGTPITFEDKDRDGDLDCNETIGPPL